MTLDYDRLKSWEFPDFAVAYGARDAMLYALGLNLGADPLDERQLRFAAASRPCVLPTMASILGRLGPWMRAPETGIDYRRIVVGEVALALHRPLPPAGSLVARHHIDAVHDKGEGRGALVVVARELLDDEDNRVATFKQTTFCRADGGFSAQDGRSDPLPEPETLARPERPADAVVHHPTLPQQALIYRLTGDLNPLHSDPQVAHKAGFERPILHGLASFGIAGWAILDRFCEARPEVLTSLSCRMSAPVFPGAVLETRLWREGGRIWFETLCGDRVVLTRGQAKVNPPCGY